MKLKCHGLELSEAISKVIKASSSNKNLPILEGIKLTAKDNLLELTATDLEITISNSINAQVIEAGEVLVPSKIFSDLVRKLTSETIEIKLVENSINIKYMDSESNISCMNIDEYPKVTEVNEDLKFAIEEKDLKDIITKTIFSASTTDLRPILKGCLFSIKNSKLTLVAIDGYRLAICKKKLIYCSTMAKELIVPARSLNEIARILKDDKKEISVIASENQIMFDLGDTKIISLLMRGDYIIYKNLIGEKPTTEVTVVKEQLYMSLDRAASVSKYEKNNTLKLDISEDIIKIASASDLGNVNEKVISALKGRDIIVIFNAKYLLDCLSVIDDEYIKLQFVSEMKPCIINPVEGDDYLYLILPMKPN